MSLGVLGVFAPAARFAANIVLLGEAAGVEGAQAAEQLLESDNPFFQAPDVLERRGLFHIL